LLELWRELNRIGVLELQLSHEESANMTSTIETCFLRNPDVVLREEDPQEGALLFNPDTKIKYTLSPEEWISGKHERVVLKVFDMLGKEVATLVNEVKEPGTYEVEFNAADLTSGVYFYELHVGSFVKTLKMILMK